MGTHHRHERLNFEVSLSSHAKEHYIRCVCFELYVYIFEIHQKLIKWEINLEVTFLIIYKLIQK